MLSYKRADQIIPALLRGPSYGETNVQGWQMEAHQTRAILRLEVLDSGQVETAGVRAPGVI